MFSLVETFFYFQISLKIMFPINPEQPSLWKNSVLVMWTAACDHLFMIKFNMYIILPLSPVLVSLRYHFFIVEFFPPLSFLGELQETASPIKNKVDEYCSGAELQYFFPFSPFFSLCFFLLASDHMLLSKWNLHGSIACSHF